MSVFTRAASLIVGMSLAVSSFAQTYPITSPVYTPTAVLQPLTLSAPGDYTYLVNGISGVTIRVSGTCTSLTAAPQGTNDGTNWTTVQAIPAAGGSLITSITGTGFWRVATNGFTKLRVHVTALTASCTFSMAGTATGGAVYLLNPNTTSNPTSIVDSTATYNWAIDSNGIGSVKLSNGTQVMPTMDAVARKGFVAITDGTSTTGVTAASTLPVATTPALVVTQSPNGDPCTLSTVPKSSVVVNVGSATTVKLVDVSASTTVYACGFAASITGTTPSVTFLYGTHTTTDCDTGATNLTGAIAPTSGSFIRLGDGAVIMKTAAAKQLCVTTGGTGPSLQGVLTYVQQ